MRSTDATTLIAERSADALVVVTMTTIFTWPEDCDTPTIRCAPLMGGASSIGLGLALAQPGRRVLVLDGDGSLLMQLGSLATVAGAAPPNLTHYVFDNGVLYEGGGRLPVAGGPRTDFVGLALAAGYPSARACTTLDELDAQLRAPASGPELVHLTIDLPGTPPWSAENPHGELPDWWFTMLHEDGRAMRRHLA